MTVITIILISIAFCVWFYRHAHITGFHAGTLAGKTDGLREGALTISSVVNTLTGVLETTNRHNSDVLDKNFVGSSVLSNTWQNIVRQKDLQIEAYIKEVAALKTELEQLNTFSEEVVEEDDDEEDIEVSVSAGKAIQGALFGERTAATTALALYGQVTAANITLDKLKSAMSLDSYLMLKELLQVPGVNNVDRKSGN